MAKTQEELNQLKIEYETFTTKLQKLSDDELKLVTGGADIRWDWLHERAIDDYSSDTELGNRTTRGERAKPATAAVADRELTKKSD